MVDRARDVEADRLPVLIVGGGPIGLCLAADLGRRGVRVRLVEQNEDRLGSAKMIVVSMRTMEICRHLGIADAVRDWGFPLDLPLDSVFCTTLTGYELGRVASPSLQTETVSADSPERERPCPQTWFDPILQRAARAWPQVTLSYRTQLVDFAQDDDRVVADLVGPDGTPERVEARYLVGCDGFGSTVRERLGIALRGERFLDRSVSIYVRSAELWTAHDRGPAYRYIMVGPGGTWSVLTTIDGRELWRIQLIGIDIADPTELDVADILRRMVGRDVAFTLDDIAIWVRKMTVADRFADGRVFLAGDAAHAHPPNGGLGMNTGIQDAFDLGWKLAALIEGWGGPLLTESYDAERRPASARAAAESLSNYHRLTAAEPEPALLDTGLAGDAARERLGRRLVAENEKAWLPVGVHLGYRYDPSVLIVPDGSERPADDTIGYEPTAYPGARAPHAWLKDGRSTLDLFGRGFVLIAFADATGADRLVAAAHERRVPFELIRLDEPEIRRLFRAALVLVRPDGHVAWRGERVPDDALGLIDRVRGAGSRIAACRLGDPVPVRRYRSGRRS